MAELVIGAVISVLVDKLASGVMSASGELIKMVISAEIHSKIEKWSDTLNLIQAVLVDADQKQVRKKSVELLLNRLHHLAYEIDDVLDDLITEATLHQLNIKPHPSTSTSKVIKFIPNKLRTVKYNYKIHKISSKLDEITTKLLDLINQKQILGLTDRTETSVRGSRRLETTSLIDHSSKIIGREGDKEALLGKLLGGETSSSQAHKVNVVSIVGLGGIGKTTLARLLYNDKKVEDHFELRAWVCVSDVFDVHNFSKTIFQAVGGGNQDFANLDLLQKALLEKLKEKRFLIVLDDVWNENFNKWESLRLPFTVGAAGSKVLVTTRNSVVAKVMKSVEAYSLELLSYEEALSLFAQHVSGSQNFDLNGALELHGKDIVKKCDRLPLALIALGRVFGNKSNVEEWVELLNSEIWNSNKENEVLPALKLSYYDLPPHLKQMFVYCCLFPKDYMFGKDELVLLWMAEGFLYESDGNNSLESFGRGCFEELLSRSFFQHITGDDSHYTMHDLINDLASSVAGEFFLMLDDKTNVQARIKASDKLHHLSFISKHNGADKKFALKNCKRLRTFLAISLASWHTWYISTNVLIELLPQLQFLRVLSLAGYYNTTEIPQFVCSLKHLRHLNFSNTEITCLPEQIGDLHNLQSLLVSGCAKLSRFPKSFGKLVNLRHLNFSNTEITCLPEQIGGLHNLQSLLVSGCANLSSFPNSFGKLVNLRHLDISHTSQLNQMSLGMVGLTGLQNLSNIIIGEDDVIGIYVIKGMLHHKGGLYIKWLQEVKDALHAKEANLRQMKGICDLIMEWSHDFDDSGNKAIEYEVLEGLRPFEKLRSLEILFYGGTMFPSWVGDPSFAFLTKLRLRGCRSCKCLPGLGHLPSLRDLFVEGMDGVERLDFEFLGYSNFCQNVAFPSLEVLRFKDMKSWEEWSTSGGSIAGAFPCLRELYMTDCRKLHVVAIELISPLGILHVERCSLKMLELFKCMNLVSVGKKEVQSVTEVEICWCERLESYNCPSSIEKLTISFCDSLTSLSFPTMDDLPPTLKYLDINECESLEVSWPINNFLSALEHLSFDRLPNLRLFPEGCFVHITELIIKRCDNIESIPCGYGFLPSRCLKILTIYNCKNLKSFPYKHLKSLESLERMSINYCPSLDESFPCGLWPPNLSYLKI